MRVSPALVLVAVVAIAAPAAAHPMSALARIGASQIVAPIEAGASIAFTVPLAMTSVPLLDSRADVEVACGISEESTPPTSQLLAQGMRGDASAGSMRTARVVAATKVDVSVLDPTVAAARNLPRSVPGLDTSGAGKMSELRYFDYTGGPVKVSVSPPRNFNARTWACAVFINERGRPIDVVTYNRALPGGLHFLDDASLKGYDSGFFS
ncbi:MAG: hypothetical protein JOZ24_13715 [Candidatus Eremiobacteraeota bacterium]|nr:hypothetical protein [Candidatus Eremiobacteraeota bacterium]